MSQDMSCKPEKTSKSRRRSPLVRTGCYTCKARHLKCDETKPACSRCTSTGRRCDRYLPPKSWLIQLKSDNLEDGGERHSFQFFREQTGPELSRYYDDFFWNNLVIQASQSQNAIKHCLVAISSFHENLESIQTVSDPLFQTQYSLQQYGKSMQLLTSAPLVLSIEETLINCILFIWFENLQNNLKNSRRHLDSGLRILKEARRSQLPHTTSMVETVLAPMLERLKLKADMYSPYEELGSTNNRDQFIPERFWGLEQACHSFAHLVNWTCTVLGQSTIIKNNNENWHRRSSKLARRLAGFDLFEAQLEDILRTARSDREPIELQAVILLKINNLALRIIIAAYLPIRESAYDRSKKEFVEIVDLCHEYLHIVSTQNKLTPSSSEIRSSDVLGNGVILPLLFTSAHCRDPLLRQRVVSLLRKYPQHEGNLDSHIASKVAGRIAEMEKQDLTLPVRSHDAIPEADRIRILSLSIYKSKTNGVNAEMMEDGGICCPTCQQDGGLAFTTRVKMSFLRFTQTATQSQMEDDWIDENGTPLTEVNLTPFQLHWRQENELLPLVGARIVSAIHKGLAASRPSHLVKQPASGALQKQLQQFWIYNRRTEL